MNRILQWVLYPTPLPWRRILIGIGACVVVGAALYAFRPIDRSADLARAEDVGFRAAKRAAFHRALARTAVDSFHRAAHRTDSVYLVASMKLRWEADRAFDRAIDELDGEDEFGDPETYDSVLVSADSLPRAILGPYAAGDTLVALPFARSAVRALADSAQQALATLRAAAQIERGRASLAIQQLDASLQSQDTVITALRTQLQIVKGTRPSWWRRGIRGIGHAGAGTLCGATAWAVGGPAWGLATGAVCAAVAGVVR